jgi:hypothetical protein
MVSPSLLPFTGPIAPFNGERDKNFKTEKKEET